MNTKDTPKAVQMRSHIEACRRGDQTVEQYCLQHGIKKPSYYYWHKRLQQQQQPLGFVPIGINAEQSADVVVSFPNGVQVSFHSAINAAVLKELACCI